MPRLKKLNTPEKRARTGERIKVAAAQAGLTLKELAERSDVSVSLVYQYVRGITSIPQEVLDRIAAVTEVHTDFFDPDKEAKAAFALPADAVVSGEIIGNGVPGRIRAELRRLRDLAQAQETVVCSRPALTATLGQIVGLARALEDAHQEGWALWRLGRVQWEENHLKEAQQSLEEAQQIFAGTSLEAFWFCATQDLAAVLQAQGKIEAAQKYLLETTQNPLYKARWRGFIALGDVQATPQKALPHYAQAALLLDSCDPDVQTQEGLPALQKPLARLLHHAGHLAAARTLWDAAQQDAQRKKEPRAYCEALLGGAVCAVQIGLWEPARQQLEQAIVLAEFTWEESDLACLARAQQARLGARSGRVDEARENARCAMRMAQRNPRTDCVIAAGLAMAETALAAGSPAEGLDCVLEAETTAQSADLLQEQAQLHELRARLLLMQSEKIREREKARTLCQNAKYEAQEALLLMESLRFVPDYVQFRFTLAQCYFALNDDQTALSEVEATLELLEKGAVPLEALQESQAEPLPFLLRSGSLNLPSLLSPSRLVLPVLEWQARYLAGTLAAKRGDTAAAFAFLRGAVHALLSLYDELPRQDFARYARQCSEIKPLLTNLVRCAGTESARKEANALLARIRIPDAPF